MEKYDKGSHIVEITKTTDIKKSGLTADNCEEVFTADQPFKCWKPLNKINQIETFIKGVRYLIKLKKTVNKLKTFSVKFDS